MYKVFLVEDEIVVREGIRNNIPWEKTPYTLAGEAPDGEMALPMIQDIKPDILITDIRMPFMDGLALAQIIKKTLPWIKIIILSGHDEFEYARKAISIGVEEYLLKPVSSQDMLQAMDKIARRIDDAKEALLSIEHLKQQVQSHSDILRERWLLDFVSGKVPAVEAVEKGRELGIPDLLAHSYTAAVIRVLPQSTPLDGDNAGTLPFLPVKRIIHSITDKYANVILFPKDERQFIMIIREMSAESRVAALPPETAPETSEASPETSIEESVYAMAQAIKYEVERNTACRLTVGIGPSVERMGELSKSYFKAAQVVDHNAALGINRISDWADIPSSNDLVDKPGRFNFDGDILLAKFHYASRKDINALIEEYTQLLKENAVDSPLFHYFILGEVVVAASKIVEELSGDIKQVLPFSMDHHTIEEIITSRETFYETLRALFVAVIEFRDSRIVGRYQSVILKAKGYIAQHYRDHDVSLHIVADHVGISPNHLSAVFSQETGENFIEYLTRVRIEKAKQLLTNTAMKSVDIASESGFNDAHYFSYIFKKNTGFSPKEYRTAFHKKPNLAP